MYRQRFQQLGMKLDPTIPNEIVFPEPVQCINEFGEYYYVDFDMDHWMLDLYYHDGFYYVCNTYAQIIRSSDRETWTVVCTHQDGANTEDFGWITYFNDMLLAFCEDQSVYASVDGITWSLYGDSIVEFTGLFSTRTDHAEYNGYLYVLAFWDGMYRSSDGSTWELVTDFDSWLYDSFVVVDDMFYVAGRDSGFLTFDPTEPENFSRITPIGLPPGTYLQDGTNTGTYVQYLNGKFYIGSGDYDDPFTAYTIYESSDFTNWSLSYTSHANYSYYLSNVVNTGLNLIYRYDGMDFLIIYNSVTDTWSELSLDDNLPANGYLYSNCYGGWFYNNEYITDDDGDQWFVLPITQSCVE